MCVVGVGVFDWACGCVVDGGRGGDGVGIGVVVVVMVIVGNGIVVGGCVCDCIGDVVDVCRVDGGGDEVDGYGIAVGIVMGCCAYGDVGHGVGVGSYGGNVGVAVVGVVVVAGCSGGCGVVVDGVIIVYDYNCGA